MPLSARSLASPCSYRTPAVDSLPGCCSCGVPVDGANGESNNVSSLRHLRGEPEASRKTTEEGQKKMRELTVPQNWARQCGHCPTMRRTAELQGTSPWSWQRFLAGMMTVVVCLYAGGELLCMIICVYALRLEMLD
jgi:hypothetical protein